MSSYHLIEEQLGVMQKAVKALTFERDQLTAQLAEQREARREEEVAGLRTELNAAQLEVSDLRTERKRALQLAAG
jgi:hypothetical protein